MNILIVEDDKGLLTLLEVLFKKKFPAATVWTLDHPQGDFIQRVIDEKIDFILLDLMMPGYTGTELLVKLKENETTKHIPVIVLSARTQTKDIVKHLEYGAEDFVPKPFMTGELMARVKASMKRHGILV